MDEKHAQIATMCECIDHCYSFQMWCEDFAQHVDPDDMVMGLDRAFDVVGDATRLHSFLALRKLDDFFGGVRPKPDDLIAANFGIDVAAVLGKDREKFLSADERARVNKGAAHLTDHLTLDRDSEADLEIILKRSLPILFRLVDGLRAADAGKDAAHLLDQTAQLLKRRDPGSGDTSESGAPA